MRYLWFLARAYFWPPVMCNRCGDATYTVVAQDYYRTNVRHRFRFCYGCNEQTYLGGG